MERAHGRHRAGLGGEVADEGRVRLVDVHHVVAAGAQLVAEHGQGRVDTERFDTAPLMGNPKVRPREIA